MTFRDELYKEKIKTEQKIIEYQVLYDDLKSKLELTFNTKVKLNLELELIERLILITDDINKDIKQGE